MPDPLSQINLRQTPQSEQADPRQVENSAGGFGFDVGPREQLRRFLVLGTEGGTYYASEKDLTKANAKVVLDFARAEPAVLVDEAVAVSEAGRAPKNNPALFALAAAGALGGPEGSQAAYHALPKVARTATHLFIFVKYSEQFRGWGRGLRQGVARWYEGKDAGRLAYQVLKYRQREGWTHRDLLRKSHPAADGEAKRDLYDFICGREPFTLDDVPLMKAFVKAQATRDVGELAALITEHGLSWEMLPTEALSKPEVWDALIHAGLPQTALFRQLPRLTRLGLLSPLSDTGRLVAAQLADAERLRKARVHPVNILTALRTYAVGHSMRGSGTWQPVGKVVDAMNDAFYLSFPNVEPAGKRTVLALDVSGSMGWEGSAGKDCALTAREASAALALVTQATEPLTEVLAFSDKASAGRYWPTSGNVVTRLPITARQRLDDVIRTVSNLPFGGTDCSLPMLWALEQGVEADTFQVYTDNETWAGMTHPHQALRLYREKTGIPAKLVVFAMTPTSFSIADPDDAGMLDIAGFDSAGPALVADFSAGRV